MSYGPFLQFNVRAWVSNQNALFNRFVRNTDHRSTQVITNTFSTTTDIGHARWWLRMRGTHPQCHITHWPRAHARSRDQWKPKYLLFCKSYGPKTWPGSGIWWELLAHNVIWISEHVVTCGHVTNRKLNIFSSKRYMITKLFGVVTYDERNSPIMSRDSLTTKSREVTWQTENEISFLVQRLWPPNLAGWWLVMQKTHA